MCGRYTLTSPTEAVTQLFELKTALELAPRFNIAPSQEVPAVRLDDAGARELVLLRWGLIPSWAKDPEIGNRLINARSETVAEKPSFRNAFKRHRCLVVADGFYEWQKPKPGSTGGKQPYWITLKDRRPFGFAGLWERWQAGDGEAVESCTILTCPANDFMRPIHGRMPVILPPEAHDAWLDPATAPAQLTGLLIPVPDERLAARAVSTHVNNPRNEDRACIAAMVA